MPVINNLIPTTELECVNAMLSINGESPVDTLTAPLSADVAMALNLVRLVTKSVQTRGWHFNTDRLVTLMRDGGTFKIATPTNTLRVMKSLIDSQVNWDIAHRNNALWDRVGNTDVFAGAEFASGVKVDIVRTIDFESMPESARTLVYIMAGRRFQEQTMGNAEVAQFTTEDEAAAFRNLESSEGLLDDTDFLQNFKDQQMVNKILNDVSRQVQSIGWHFNTRLSVGIAPTANQIVLPADVLRAYKSNIAKMGPFNLAHRNTKMYDVQNDTFDVTNLGLPEGKAYLDLVMFITYTDLPEAAKKYIRIKTSRQLESQKPNTSHNSTQPNSGFTEHDEQRAWRDLCDAEGLVEDFNMIRNTTVGRAILRQGTTLYQDTGGIFRR